MDKDMVVAIDAMDWVGLDVVKDVSVNKKKSVSDGRLKVGFNSIFLHGAAIIK